MYSYPIAQASPLVNAFLQTLLLFVFPLVVAVVLGGALGLWLFFHCHPLFLRSAKPAAAKPLSPLRSMAYLGLLPMLLLLLKQIPGLADGTAAALLLTLGAILYLAFHVYSGLYTLDASVLEMALASGLSRRAIIRRVLVPLGKHSLVRVFLETALFLLAMGAVAGCAAGSGLTGLAVRGGFPGTDGLTWLWCLLLLAPLFLLISWLSSRFAKKAGQL